MAKKKPKSIVVIGRRWFNKGPGNTYYSALIMVDGDVVHKIDFAYGYGDQYLYGAFDWLEKEGRITPLERGKTGGRQAPWRWAQEHGVKLEHTSTDVARKKDL